MVEEEYPLESNNIPTEFHCNLSSTTDILPLVLSTTMPNITFHRPH